MKKAVILAAGEGQRLRPFTVTKPKAMLSIAGKPILQYVIESLEQNGIREVVIVVGYHREQVFDYFGTGEQFGVEISYVVQERQLGTAHALAQAKNAVKGEFILLPGDNLIDGETIAKFVAMQPDAVLVKAVDDPSRYGIVVADGGLVKSIIEKPAEAESNIINTGIYMLSHRIFEFIDETLDIPDVLNTMREGGHPLHVQETKGTWLDVVYPWDIVRLNDAVLHRITARLGGTIEAGATIKGQVFVGKDTVIRSNSYIMGPATIGENCEIGPNVCIMPSTSIGNNVVISPFVVVENSVIGSDVNIGPASVIQNSVVDHGCIIKGHFNACSGIAEVKIGDDWHTVDMGTMLGADCRIGNSVVTLPGSIVGNYCEIQPMKLVSGLLPDKSHVY
jgi:UDP-N-acetylglucosamine diphosphorylase / glucose-1-phosphate thymidylyltransferase / UDP-N-acetylgalactosamine diphosphorylase / glucosamine-1-phosphate N-acetyltransferase / galactosamine-1-phosphate N-acetyltransferase